MGVERDRGALPEPAPDDQVGRRNHSVRLDQRLGNLVPLDLKTKSFQECRDDFRGAAAVSGRIVRRNLDDFGEETRLCFGMLAHEVAYRALDWRHRISPRPMSGVEALDAHSVISRRHMRRQLRAQGLVIEIRMQVGEDRATRTHRLDPRQSLVEAEMGRVGAIA